MNRTYRPPHGQTERTHYQPHSWMERITLKSIMAGYIYISGGLWQTDSKTVITQCTVVQFDRWGKWNVFTKLMDGIAVFRYH